MSLSGNAIGGKRLIGKITAVPEVVYTDAYKIAVENGFDGTVEEWLATIKGEKGDKGDKGDSIKGDKGDRGEKGDPFTYEDFTAEQLAALKGDKGDKGDKGAPGVVTIDGLPPASETQLGGVKVGAFLEASEDGTLNVVPSYTTEGGETYTETFQTKNDDWMSWNWDGNDRTKVYYLTHKVATIESWQITQDGDYFDDMNLLVSEDGGVYFYGNPPDDYNNNGNVITVTYVSAGETISLVPEGGGGSGVGLTDITSKVSHNSMGSIYKAYDTGTSIYLYFRGESENIISISGRTEKIIYAEAVGNYDPSMHNGKTYGGTLGSFSLPYVDIDDAWAVIHYMPK